MLDALCLKRVVLAFRAHGSWLRGPGQARRARSWSVPSPVGRALVAMSLEAWAMTHQACIKHQSSIILANHPAFGVKQKS